MTSRLVALALLTLAAAGCGPVKAVYVHPEYEMKDRRTLKRIGAYALPFFDSYPRGQRPPDELLAPPKLPDLVAAMARRWVHDHKDYLVLRAGRVPDAAWAATDTAYPMPERVRALAGGDLDGILLIHGTVRRTRRTIEIDLFAQLYRARDGVLVAEVEASGGGAGDDPDVARMADVWEKALGPEVRPYVAPLFLVLRPALETLPSPVLDEKDIEEKIFLGD